MKTPKHVHRTWLIAISLAVVAAPAAAEEPFHFVDGQLERPAGYREWIYVGAPLTPNDMNDGMAAFPEFHNVYIDPVSWEHWKRTGEFREGTILIKEMIDVATKKAASGNGYFMGEFIGLEATVKSRTLFPDEPGNWAYFSFTNEDHETVKERAAPMPVGSCNSCHGSLAADDFVFTQHYPVLRDARSNPMHAAGGTRDRLPRTLPGMQDPMESGAK
jgi:hypothetical protein